MNAARCTSERLEDLFKTELSNTIETSDSPVPRPEHAHNTGHKPLWNDVKFIDRDPYYYTHRVKEPIHINFTLTKSKKKKPANQSRASCFIRSLMTSRPHRLKKTNSMQSKRRDLHHNNNIVRQTKNLAFIVVHHDE